jgi:hypothetical protein
VIFWVLLFLSSLSVLIFRPHLDSKHHKPILLHRVEDQLSYSYEEMDTFMVFYRPILVVTVSERRLEDARLWTGWCKAYPSGILLCNKLVTTGLTSFIRGYLAIYLTPTEYRDIFWDTAANLSAGPTAGTHVTCNSSHGTRMGSWHSRQTLYIWRPYHKITSVVFIKDISKFTCKEFAWLIVTGSGLDECIYWHLYYNYFQLEPIITDHNQWLPKTRAIPYWTTSVFSSTVTGLLEIYESVTSSVSVVRWLRLHTWTLNFWILFYEWHRWLLLYKCSLQYDSHFSLTN